MSEPLEFGVFHEFARRAGQGDAEVFAEGMDLVDAAEAWGLDVMWLAELHVDPPRSVLASPLTIAAAIAGRTSRLKIGPAVQILPLADPLRLAEETATLDHLSHGRLIFGAGRSGFPRSYAAYGVPYAESRDRFAEALAVLKAAWTELPFSHQGTYYHYDQVSVVPRPYQQPHPPIRIAATSSDTFPVVGAQGYPIFAAVRLGTLSDLAPDIRAYRAAWRAAGHPGEGQVFLRVPVYVADTAEAALREPEASMMAFFRTMGARYEESATVQGARAAEQRAERGAALQEVTYEAARREKVIVGSPAQVVDRLKELQAELGLNGILAELNCGGQIPHAQVRRSLQLLCQEVQPHFR